MDNGEVLVAFIYLVLTLGFLTLSGFFLYWTAKILIVLPSCLLRITAALEKIANKK